MLKGGRIRIEEADRPVHFPLIQKINNSLGAVLMGGAHKEGIASFAGAEPLEKSTGAGGWWHSHLDVWGRIRIEAVDGAAYIHRLQRVTISHGATLISLSLNMIAAI